MPSSAVNICVLTLVLLSFQQICQCRPHRSKRGLVKDYFVPDTLIFASDKFEKGEDGKYHLKKSADKQDSEVNYISADNADEISSTVPGESEVETFKGDSKAGETATLKTDQIKKELSDKEAELLSSPAAVKEAAEKIDIKSEKASFSPVDTQFVIPPKPNAKDEIMLKTEIPVAESEEKGKEKISIGQVPDLSSRLIPELENIKTPILIPIRHISYRAMKIIPFPPVDASDRLPVPYEDDIVGEGAHESESEEVSQPLAEEERGYHLGNPLVSLLSFHNILKDLKEADKEDVDKESKVVDVMGKKFLMQSNVMKYPSSDNSHTFIRFMSVKPLDEMKPTDPKEIAAEETLKKELEVEERKGIEMEKEETTAKEKTPVEEKKEMNESEIKKEFEKELVKEADILKAEETQLKIKFEKNVPKEVMLKNVGTEETRDEMESNAKEIKSVEEVLKQTDMHNIPHSQVKDIDLIVGMENKEIDVTEKPQIQLEFKESKGIKIEKEENKEKEKTETIIVESKRDDDTMLKTMHEEKENDEKTEASDTFMKKYDEKKMDKDSKKHFFLIEKKAKEKSTEDIEDSKPKKENGKKKKKCKCEDKDSDSDDDVDE